MMLDRVERWAMNNPLRAAHQHSREAAPFRDVVQVDARDRSLDTVVAVSATPHDVRQGRRRSPRPPA